MMTTIGMEVPDKILGNYLMDLVGRFYKILPMWEDGEKTLPEYMDSLMAELIGLDKLMEPLHNDASYLSLILILRFLMEGDCEVKVVKREVFKGISICKKLKKRYCGAEV